MTVVLADAGDYDEMNRVWREFFLSTRRPAPPAPCSSATATASEIECIALAGESPAQGI
jgi:enamine deaminase RidA (YjgF/YER057c/UK114 family)